MSVAAKADIRAMVETAPVNIQAMTNTSDVFLVNISLVRTTVVRLCIG